MQFSFFSFCLWPPYADFLFSLSSDTSQQHQSIFLWFSSFPSFLFILAFFRYSAFQYVRTTLIRVFMYLTMSAPCNSLLILSCSPTFFFLHGTIDFSYNVLSNTLRAFISSEVIFQASSRILTWVVLKFYKFLFTISGQEFRPETHMCCVSPVCCQKFRMNVSPNFIPSLQLIQTIWSCQMLQIWKYLLILSTWVFF